MKTNPPWTDSAVRKYWDALLAKVGPDLMPVEAAEAKIPERLLTSLRYTDDEAEAAHLIRSIKKLQKKRHHGYKEYGCGHYGCVMPTNTPGVVFKITTDPTEAVFVAAYLSVPQHKRPVGIVPYHSILRAGGTSRGGRPVYFIWRDEAEYVGEVDAWVREKPRDFEKDYYQRSWRITEKLITDNLRMCRLIREILKSKARTGANIPALIAEAVEDRQGYAEQVVMPRGNKLAQLAWLFQGFFNTNGSLQSEVMGDQIGRAFQESFTDLGLILADVHFGNLGLPTGALAEEIGRAPIITDPGHAIPIDDRYNGIRIEEI